MLSILIPIYNFDVRPLVKDLLEQVKEISHPVEIICFDDGSKEEIRQEHRVLAGLKGVTYQELPHNLGRAAIRNALAEAAQYPYLLFMDGDSKVVRSNYLSKYISELDPETLIYGGRVYQKNAPKNPSLIFHWRYGSQREQVPVNKRQEQPYHAFQTNNFLIPRSVFLQIKFDESIRQYGHEDTLFGFELRRRTVPLKHIDNPLEHIGLEETTIFLDKTKQGVENLYYLSKDYPFIQTKLLNTYSQIDKLGLSQLMLYGLGPFRGSIKKQLYGAKSSLRWFDIYKLILLLEVAQQSKS